jgi:hypothetical protein
MKRRQKLKIKISELIDDIRVSGGKVENDYFGQPQLIAKIGIKLNKKKMFFLKLKAFFCNLFNVPIEIINDRWNVDIKDNIKY